MAEYSLAELARSGIYQIVNTVNGKRYIGSARCFKTRWAGHRSHLNRGLHHSAYLQRAWLKYGEQSFSFEILSFREPRSLIAAEQIAIDSYLPEYNVCKIAGSTAGRKTSDETKALLALAITGKKRSKETIARMSEAWTRRPPSPPMSQEARAKLSAAHKGRPKPRTAEHSKKIGMAKRKISDEQVAEIRAMLLAGAKQRMVANLFNCSEALISCIKSQKKRVM